MLIRAVVAGILAQCRREADTRSPEAERHSVGAHRGHTATGAAVIGGLVVIGGAVAIGAAVIGGLVVIGAVATGAATSPFLSADLVFRSSTGIPITAIIRTIITATVRTRMGTGMTLRTVTAMIITALPLTGTDTTAIKDMATAIKATATAIRATAVKGTDTAIKAAATTIKPTAMAIDLRLSSYSVG